MNSIILNDFCSGSDCTQDEWSAESQSGSPLRSSSSHVSGNASNVPLPTIYTAEGRRKVKPTITELVMYNMASMIASVAVGFDVRISNVSPVHPKLQPQEMLSCDDNNISSASPMHGRNEFLTDDRSPYDYNQYHGPPKYVR